VSTHGISGHVDETPLVPAPKLNRARTKASLSTSEWIEWKDYEVPKNRNLESVSAKNAILVSPNTCVPAHLYPPGPRDHLGMYNPVIYPVM
jgi:hypothetical protein